MYVDWNAISRFWQIPENIRKDASMCSCTVKKTIFKNVEQFPFSFQDTTWVKNKNLRKTISNLHNL